LIETLIVKLEELEGKKEVSTYSLSLLKIFGSDRNTNLSPNTFRTSFISLFNLLDSSKQGKYVEYLMSINNGDKEEEADDDLLNITKKKSNEDLIFAISSLKQIIMSKSAKIEEGIKDKILEYFFIEYYSNNNKYMSEIIEDRLLLIILTKSKTIIKEKEDGNHKEIKESVNIKHLIHFNEILQGLIKRNKISVEMNDYKVYSKYFKEFKSLFKGAKVNENKKLSVIFSLSFLIMIIYLKNVVDFEEILADLYESAKNLSNDEANNEWEQIFMDLVIAILSKGKNVLSEYVSSCFKKISKQLGFNSVQVILDFLKEDIYENKNDVNMEEDENEKNGEIDKAEEEDEELNAADEDI